MKFVYLAFGALALCIVCRYAYSNFTNIPKKNMAEQYLLDSQNRPTPGLKNLLTLLSIDPENSLDSLVAITQKEWLRKPGTERWHMQEKFEDKQQVLFAAFDKLGCVQEIAPRKTHYSYAVVLGSAAMGLRTRLAYVAQLWTRGITFDTLIFLGSQRPLDPEQESQDILLNTQAHTKLPAKSSWQLSGPLPKVEIDMIRMVYDQAQLPEKFARVPVLFLDTPQQVTPEGTMRRANTEDTVRTLVANKLPVGSYLFISNQPYVGYQDSTVRTVMPATMEVETVGCAASPTNKIAVLLDTVARWLYQEQRRRKSVS